MSNNYEMMYILRPDLSEEKVREAVGKYQSFIADRGAEDIQIQNRGKRRLAYPIKKFLDGIYIQMNYQADGTQIAPLERAMRLGEEVIRYMTLKVKAQPEGVSEGETEAAAEEE
ncbi:ribosomal protein S6 [Xenococcus sp. PCC 7305]|uniref:30S ribosomal protein S6 n=1 Tax=Xenococcus sp. PCC 7305 TaxID=102125 RepID=UPI0002AD1174|nr:30S ribosomal protein S6 [Xenococcus sp. PCC 7305]ELS04754.1 ribosomal protein S6 [Xenococcus sp. PCC 7305]